MLKKEKNQMVTQEAQPTKTYINFPRFVLHLHLQQNAREDQTQQTVRENKKKKKKTITQFPRIKKEKETE